eukprot:NODE_7084_length_474_cov_4.550588_g6269_i0.p1 GENE.NODE_7084_length_474_cov_4.550588_g6269_i0~~NODE_7084_length_474_cov_4.550588_g6269_i0.p1  ORF type:complete len:68 (-),score=2.95 NODE_7084_length_474_cov_4.550588_g6269_i0:223-426(-)
METIKNIKQTMETNKQAFCAPKKQKKTNKKPTKLSKTLKNLPLPLSIKIANTQPPAVYVPWSAPFRV